MRKLIFFLLILLSISSACESINTQADNLLSKEEMVPILRDMMLLEATYNTRLIRLDDKEERMERFSFEILDKYNVTKEDFDASYEYYVSNSEEFEGVLELVFEELSKMETEAAGLNEKEIQNDSTLIQE